MKLVHYSTQSGLTSTDPAKIGTSGVRGNFFRAGLPKVGVTYFYKEGSTPEDIVTSTGKHKYITRLTPDQRVYDLGSDSEQLVSAAREKAGGSFDHPHDFHQALVDAGYHGYENSRSSLPHVVALFHPQSLKQVMNDPKGHRNTQFDDSAFDAEPTNESIVAEIVDKLLG